MNAEHAMHAEIIIIQASGGVRQKLKVAKKVLEVLFFNKVQHMFSIVTQYLLFKIEVLTNTPATPRSDIQCEAEVRC